MTDYLGNETRCYYPTRKRLAKELANEALEELKREGIVDASFAAGLVNVTPRSTTQLEIYNVDIEFGDNTEQPIRVSFEGPISDGSQDVRGLAVEEIKRQIVAFNKVRSLTEPPSSHILCPVPSPI